MVIIKMYISKGNKSKINHGHKQKNIINVAKYMEINLPRGEQKEAQMSQNGTPMGI